MRKIFDETRIGSLHLQNRLIRSATWEGMCTEEGRPTSKLASYYAGLARGRIGLIITGYAFIRPDGKQLPGQMGIHDDSFGIEMKALADAVHREGGKICLQLVHAGGQTTSKTIGTKPVAPSAVNVEQFPEEPAELTPASIQELIAQFGRAASRAKEYGFDAVQLHASHGYLINQFLSPLTNNRTDSYGGSSENRLRFLLEVYRSVRQGVGAEFPVLVKLNGSDNLQGGLEIEDAVEAAKALDDEGIDGIEVSGGTPASGSENPVRQGIDSREREAYNLPLAYRVKNAVTCPVAVVGGMRSLEVIEGIIRREEADYVAMSRPFIREPKLAMRWQAGDETRARCISCNGCFKPGMKEGGIYCVVDKIERESKGSSL